MRWLLVTSGQGPAECELFVFHLVAAIQADAAGSDVACELIEAIPGVTDRSLASALLRVEGVRVDAFLSRWKGTHKWACRSPLRATCRRKNWFAGVELIAAPETLKWRESDIHIDAFRSSGPGGQHANKTSSAVRVTHMPTGLTAIAQEERSQHRNRALALARLDALLRSQTESKQNAARSAVWREHAALVRGAEIAVYRGPDFHR